MTDVCKVRSGSDSEVGKDAFDTPKLERELEVNRPAWVAFNGKNAARAVLPGPVEYGEREALLGPSRVFVLPSTSGAARRYWDVEHWLRLAAIVAAERGKRTNVSSDAVEELPPDEETRI